VGDQPIHDTSDFTHALHSRSAGSVNVGVIRDKKEQTLTLTLPERKDSGEMIEESFEAPEMDAETHAELSEAQSEVAKLRPQMALITEETRKASEEMRKAFSDQQKQMREQAKKLRQQLQPMLHEQLLKHLDMERLRRQMTGDSLDI
jgi:molecular chaperone DnaK (HSP70)